MKPLIYIAGPYASDPVRGTQAAIHTAEELHASGLITPVVPHLTMLWDLVSSHEDPEFWYGYDLEVLAHCDGLLRIPGKSSGADKEVTYAVKNRIPVFLSIPEVLRAYERREERV